MARRQATGFSLSVSRAREYESLPLLPPSFLVPVSSLARSHVRSTARRPLSPSLSRSPLHSVLLAAGSPPPSRVRYSLVRSSLLPPPPSPPVHIAGTAHRFLRRYSLTRSPSASRRIRRRILLSHLFFLTANAARMMREERPGPCSIITHVALCFAVI